MAEDPESAFKDTLLAIGRGELSLAHVLGLNPERLRRVGEHAVGLIRAGQVETGEALLVDLGRVDGAAPVPVLLLAFARAARGAHAAALEAYAEAIERAERLGSPVLVQKAVFGRAQSWLALGSLAQGADDLRRAAEGPDPAVVASAQVHLERLPVAG